MAISSGNILDWDDISAIYNRVKTEYNRWG